MEYSKKELIDSAREVSMMFAHDFAAILEIPSSQAILTNENPYGTLVFGDNYFDMRDVYDIVIMYKTIAQESSQVDIENLRHTLCKEIDNHSRCREMHADVFGHVDDFPSLFAWVTRKQYNADLLESLYKRKQEFLQDIEKAKKTIF